MVWTFFTIQHLKYMLWLYEDYCQKHNICQILMLPKSQVTSNNYLFVFFRHFEMDCTQLWLGGGGGIQQEFPFIPNETINPPSLEIRPRNDEIIYLFGTLAVMSTGGPGGPKWDGNISIHIWSFPYRRVKYIINFCKRLLTQEAERLLHQGFELNEQVPVCNMDIIS